MSFFEIENLKDLFDPTESVLLKLLVVEFEQYGDDCYNKPVCKM